jgi:hypothetical protein
MTLSIYGAVRRIDQMLATIACGYILLENNTAASQPILNRYNLQQDQRIRVQKICEEQYQRAAYVSTESYYVNGWGGEIGGRYRLMLTDKGVQAISPVVSQKRDGSFQCHRGDYWPFRFFETPRLIGKEYERRALRGFGGMLTLEEAIKMRRLDLIETRRSLVKFGECPQEESIQGRCLFLIEGTHTGPVDRELVGLPRGL